MRIIRGRYQRRQIVAPTNLPVRPTTDMAKESLFNILENYMDFEGVNALDLFAGTGNISYELVSRGCPKVTSVDLDFGCVKFIRETALKLDMKELIPVRSDVFRFLASQKMQYDLIFADPPYDCQRYDELVSLIFDMQSAMVVEQSNAAQSDIGMHHQMFSMPVKCERMRSDGRKKTTCRNRLRQMETAALPMAWK